MLFRSRERIGWVREEAALELWRTGVGPIAIAAARAARDEQTAGEDGQAQRGSHVLSVPEEAASRERRTERRRKPSPRRHEKAAKQWVYLAA